MYSGTTLRSHSGKIAGVHQKIDRLSYRSISEIADKTWFPPLSDIIHFEGNNGPDGLKRKSPGKDEPWHYIDPEGYDDTGLLTMIEDHIWNLTKSLKKKDRERSAFEAAWLAHAIIDGLTPAHHYPLEEKLEELRGGQGLETRSTVREKLVLPGENRRDQLKNNWEFWGAKGVMTTHGLYEWGVATTIAPMRFTKHIVPDGNELVRVRQGEFITLYKEELMRIHGLRMYERFQQRGWTQRLVRETRKILIPEMVKLVTLAWYSAMEDNR